MMQEEINIRVKKGRDLGTTKPSSQLNETEIVRETMFWKIMVLNHVA